MNRLCALAVSAAALAPATLAMGHGTMSNPPSRIYRCWTGDCMNNPDPFLQGIINQDMDACWNWNEKVNFFSSDEYDQLNIPFHVKIPDGQIASAANPRFAALDTVSDQWPTAPVESGPFEMTIHASTPHNPLKMYVFITTPDHRWGEEPLAWDELQLLNTGPVTLEDNEYRFTVNLPPRVGKHSIVTVWQRIDPVGEGFYMVSDVDYGNCEESCECRADLNFDGYVDGADVGLMLAEWGQPGADVNDDGTTNGADLGLLLSSWGVCGIDCNNNGVGDYEEILNGLAEDCNHDGVPDDCQEQVDCDGNGRWDACDIADGLVADCNTNAVPDSCDIADGLETDKNADGIPDACQPEGYSYSLEFDAWEGSFNAYLTINNGSGSCITGGWEVLMTFADGEAPNIESIWDGQLAPHPDENVIRIVNPEWDGSRFCSGTSKTIGMACLGAPTLPVSVYLNGSPAEEEP
ncbi:MAG: lytic polysaccharide monooxygenase [Phycisphaerales bacterium]|nr:lytic polysaccharide monooxygenase [Phycisphaerales bacterium]